MALSIFRCHIIAFFSGFVLDLIIGDPQGFPHAVRFIGKLISFLERHLYNPDSPRQILRGGALVFFVIIITAAVSAVILSAAYILHPIVFAIAEGLMTWQVLAAKSLRTESVRVYEELIEGKTEEARAAVSMIVGRDTECLDEAGVTRAAVETVAENTTDGVIAPMIYTALGGPVLGLIYKAVNTMDSMLGYKNERYLYFGRAAARLDDAVNLIPARISACLMIFSACIAGKDLSGREALRIYRRDRKKSASSNAGQTESACAGALGVRLAGDARYFGKAVRKPYIGDNKRAIEAKDIKRANRLMYAAAFICEAACLAAMFSVI